MSNNDAIVDLSLLAKVEGHLTLHIDIKEKKSPLVQVKADEGVRLFEGFLIGRKYDEVIRFVARICGFCPTSHNLSSIKAFENAFGIQPSEQTIELRKLLTFAEVIQSHTAHLYLFSLFDFIGGDNLFSLSHKNPELVKNALKIREAANLMTEVVGGRAVHLLSTEINGFSSLPTTVQLKKILSRMKSVKNDVLKTAELFSSLSIPYFERKTEYVSLQNRDEYALYDGYLASTERLKSEIDSYKKEIKELMKDYSNSKFYLRNDKYYYTGALARVNLNYKQLSDSSKETAEKLGMDFPCYNPFKNNLAQAIELIHCFDESIALLEELSAHKIRSENHEVKIREGTGVGAVEAPRGTLFHKYTVDKSGLVQEADVVTPTAQFLGNIEEDIKALIASLPEQTQEKTLAIIESLVRSYDPCVSCSVH